MNYSIGELLKREEARLLFRQVHQREASKEDIDCMIPPNGFMGVVDHGAPLQETFWVDSSSDAAMAKTMADEALVEPVAPRMSSLWKVMVMSRWESLVGSVWEAEMSSLWKTMLSGLWKMQLVCQLMAWQALQLE